jgi:hypothetical protein
MPDRPLHQPSLGVSLRLGLALALLAACARVGSGTGDPSDGSAVDGPGSPTVARPVHRPVVVPADATGQDLIMGRPDAGEAGPCKNLQCRQTACAGGGTTSLTGTVYAPNGKLPLYNALVYVPNAAVPPLPAEITCDRCGTIPAGEPIAAALTDAHGVFTLANVPSGANVPLVIQVGRWRRQITVPSVTACTENRLTDPQVTRLPRNRGEGDLPRMAVTTGICDNLVCLLPKLGIDPVEYGISGEGKAVTFFAGGQPDPGSVALTRFGPRLAQMRDASVLWGNLSELQKYDLAILSCECAEQLDNKGAAAWDAMTKYLAMGGRVFGTDFQYVWYKNSTDAALRGLASIPGGGIMPGDNPVLLDTSFPKGKALADWFAFVRPGFPYGEITCERVFDNFTSVATSPASRVWGSSAAVERMGTYPRFVTVNTPAGAPPGEQCGRAVHLDAHISPLEAFDVGTYPRDCGTDLVDGEQLLAFFLFDVAACVQEDSKPVLPPIIVE